MRQRNICVNLLHKSTTQCTNNIDVKKYNGQQKFWKTIRPKFWNKCKTAKTIILVENDKILQDDKGFIKYFTNQCRRHWGDGGAS